MKLNRRDFLKLSALISATVLTDIGLEQVLCAETPPAFVPMNNGGQELEASIDLQTGEVKTNPNILMRHSACLGCYSSCGNRVKINKRTGQILSVSGNPFNPNNAEPHLPMKSSLHDAYHACSQYKDFGLKHRATLCARGQGTLQAHYDPYRILLPLKRAGKRGEGKWRPITWEKALRETVDGGAIFDELGERQHVEGLRQVRDLMTAIDRSQPEMGAKANQLVFIGGRGDGRTPFAARFADSFGTVNFFAHTVS
jgi:tetrathionate reductase subunit A